LSEMALPGRIELGFTSLMVCKRCGGQVLASKCIHCGAEHDRWGNWLRPVVGTKLSGEGQHQSSHGGFK